MRIVRSAGLALIITLGLIAHEATYADADSDATVLLPDGATIAATDPGDPGLPPDD